MNNLTVVSGLWRSGSSMMMQILEAGGLEPIFHYHKPDQYNERGYYEIEEKMAPRVYAEICEGQHPNSCVKILTPFLKNNDLIYLAKQVIFMQRNYDEIIASTEKSSGYSPFKRKLQILEKEAKEFLAGQRLAIFYLNYNEIIEDPKVALTPIKFLLKEFESACSAVEESLYKSRGKNEAVF